MPSDECPAPSEIHTGYSVSQFSVSPGNFTSNFLKVPYIYLYYLVYQIFKCLKKSDYSYLKNENYSFFSDMEKMLTYAT